MSSLKHEHAHNPELYGGSLVIAKVSNEVEDRVGAIQDAFISHTLNSHVSLADHSSLYVNVANIVVPGPSELLPDAAARMVQSRDTVKRALSELSAEVSEVAITFDAVDVALTGLIVRASETEQMNKLRSTLGMMVGPLMDVQPPEEITMMAMHFKSLEAQQSIQNFYDRYFKMYFQPFRTSPIKSLQLREYKPENQGMRVIHEVELFGKQE